MNNKVHETHIHIFIYKLDSREVTDINVNVNSQISKHKLQW